MGGKIALGILIFCMIIGLRCASELLCEPVVVSTGADHTSDPQDLPFWGIHTEFAENYSGHDLSISLRHDVIQNMEDKADSLGEDAEILYDCVRATYEDWTIRPHRIPCYAEKCSYENVEVWAIAFNRANSFDEENLSHVDVFFMSCSSQEVLYYFGCD